MCYDSWFLYALLWKLLFVAKEYLIATTTFKDVLKKILRDVKLKSKYVLKTIF